MIVDDRWIMKFTSCFFRHPLFLRTSSLLSLILSSLALISLPLLSRPLSYSTEIILMIFPIKPLHRYPLATSRFSPVFLFKKSSSFQSWSPSFCVSTPPHPESSLVLGADSSMPQFHSSEIKRRGRKKASVHLLSRSSYPTGPLRFLDCPSRINVNSFTFFRMRFAYSFLLHHLCFWFNQCLDPINVSLLTLNTEVVLKES